jgi:hypothetical protein
MNQVRTRTLPVRHVFLAVGLLAALAWLVWAVPLIVSDSHCYSTNYWEYEKPFCGRNWHGHY